MRTFFLVIILLFIALASMFYLFITGIKASGRSRQTISVGLVDAHVYQKAQDFLIQTAQQSDSNGQNMAFAVPLIQKELTPAYLQTKVETLLADTDAWIGGGPSPVLSFEDIKQKLVTQYRGTITQLEDMEKQAKEMQQQAASEALPGEALPSMAIPSVSDLINKKAEIPLGPRLGMVHTIGVLVRWWRAITAGFVILFMLLAFLAGSKVSALRWIGATLLAAAIFNILPVAVALFGSRALISLISGSNIPEIAATLFNALAQPVITSYARTGVIAICISFFLAVTCFIAAASMGKPTRK